MNDPRFHRRRYDPPGAQYRDHSSYPNWLVGAVKLVLTAILLWAAKTLYDVDRMLSTTNYRLTRIERHLKLDPISGVEPSFMSAHADEPHPAPDD